MRSAARILLALLAIGTAAVVTVAAVVAGAYYYVEPGLPNAEDLREVKLQEPLRVYTRDGRLIQQFGTQKRTPVEYENIPPLLIEALIAAEDDRFFQHPGIDFLVTVRSALNYLVSSGERVPGGSTITQQVAREYFLSRDYSVARKIKELFLALRIEREFSKEEILELFFNTFFLGQHSYGVVAAAHTYFGKELHELTLSDAAILAGIPQGPSIMNPIYSPDNAKMRRSYVLRRMRELGYISQAEHDEALEVPVRSERHGLQMELDAPYVAEMVRAEMVRRFGDAAYTAGFKVTTTLDSRLQAAADKALRDAVVAYDRRHGYRGPVGRIELPELIGTEGGELATEDVERLHELLADYPRLVDLETGIVLSASEEDARVFLPSRGVVTVGLDAVAWAAPYLNDNAVGSRPQSVGEVLETGQVVRFAELEGAGLRLAQLPDVQGGFVALDPRDGAIVALSGGFDFYLNSFNRAVQARRQPGSAFKPFVYSAALENGFTTARIVDDAPVTIRDPLLESVWRPENYTNRFYGRIRFREALVRSLNAATVRIILEAGVPHTVRHLRQFGFEEDALPRNAALALGAGNVSPLSLTAGYAVFANGGFRVEPYFIDRIEDAAGDVLYQARPAIACRDCDESEEDTEGKVAPALIDDVTDLYPSVRVAPRAISPQNAFLVADMLRDVVQPGGTGVAASRDLGRNDIGGKTGTTNDNRDAWFAGFGGDIVASAWVGFDQDRPLGVREQGGVTAIPMWTAFMKEALEGVPYRPLEEPPGIVEVRINPKTGLVASSATSNAVFEKFRIGHVPEREQEPAFTPPGVPSTPGEPEREPGKIF